MAAYRIGAILWLLVLVGLSGACRGSAIPGAPPSSAQASTAPAEDAAPKTPADEPTPVAAADRGLFYRAESTGAVVYLLGSIHVGSEELYPMRRVIEDAFASADVAVVEVDLDESSAGALAPRLVEAMTFPEGQSLDDHLSPATKALLEAYIAETRLPYGMFARLRPWAAAVLVTTLELQKAGLTAAQGMDKYFLRKARQSQKKIVALETAEQQLALFTGIEPEVEDLMLRESLESRTDLPDTMDGAMSAWKRGDPEAMLELLVGPMNTPGYRPLFERIFLERNRRMAAAVEDYLSEEGTYFVVVGSGHLVGEGSIVALLRRAGHPVEQF